MNVLLTVLLSSVSLTTAATVPTTAVTPANAQVRIALSLTTWEKFVPHGGRGKVTYRPTTTQKVTLRAALDRASNFYVGDWHFVTRPLLWARHTRQYKTQLTVFQRLGKDRQVEEKLGSMVAKGTLQAYRDFYTLQNYQKKTFRDPNGNPRLRVVTGFVDDSKLSRVARAVSRRTTRPLSVP